MRSALVVGCVLALGALSATAYAAQRGGPARERVLSSVEQPAVVVPAPREAPVARSWRRAGPEPADAWVADAAARTGIPAPAVRAYGRAALRAPAGCHLGWTTLAGVGWVESGHGTLSGRSLGEDGVPSDPVLGPALDGRGPVAAIVATAAGTAWHGDPTWEHAVGPMQFLPGTWAAWEVDADRDGAADPHDLDDAAAAAAGYLCAAGADLATADGWSAAVLAYNRSGDYLAAVHAAATAYAGR